MMALLTQASRAMAADGIKSFSLERSTTQAGAHPDISTNVGLGPEPQRAADRITFDWPPGLNVLPPAVSLCDLADFAMGQCSSDSQLGLITIREADEGAEVVSGTFPVFSLEPPVERAFALIGFVIPGFAEPIYGDLYAGEWYREDTVSLTLYDFPRDAPLASLDLELWGVPADPSHDAARFPTGTNGCPGLADTSCNSSAVPSSLPAHAQIENPTFCSQWQTTTARLATYEDEGRLEEATSVVPPTTGCNLLSFDPSADLALTTAEARSPTGLELDLEVPQSQSVVAPAPSELRAVEVVFEGGVFPGSGTEALGICPEEETGFYDTCPDNSRLGTATVDSELWPSPVSGAISITGGNLKEAISPT
jgi:hypothetical protein